jgi:hypothetical protein
MKKLLSVAAVAAIVTSAFAFSPKGIAVFCVRQGSACTFKPNFHIDDINGSTFLQYPLADGQWDGQSSTCTGATTANCSQSVKLIAD